MRTCALEYNLQPTVTLAKTFSCLKFLVCRMGRSGLNTQPYRLADPSQNPWAMDMDFSPWLPVSPAPKPIFIPEAHLQARPTLLNTQLSQPRVAIRTALEQS